MDLAEGLGLLARLEYEIPDVTQWAFLARQRFPVGILSHATNGNPRPEPRYRYWPGVQWRPPDADGG